MSIATEVEEEEVEEEEEEEEEGLICFGPISAQTSSSAVEKASMCLESNSCAKRRTSEEHLRPLVVFSMRCIVQFVPRVRVVPSVPIEQFFFEIGIHKYFTHI